LKETKVLGMAFSSDGQWLQWASKKALHGWEHATGQESLIPLTYGKDVIDWAVFSRDGERLAAAVAGGKVIVWETRSGRQIQEFPPEFRDSLPSLNLDGTRMLTILRRKERDVRDVRGAVTITTRVDRDVQVWDVDSGTCVLWIRP